MKVKIEFEIDIKDIDHTEEELEDFLRFEFRDNGVLSGKNPFKGESVDPIFGTFYWSYEE